MSISKLPKCTQLILNGFILFVTSLNSIFTPAYAATPETQSYFYDDWVPMNEGHPLCHGYYSQLPLPFPNQSPTALTAEPTTITADQGLFTREGDSTLTGNVHLIQGNRQVFADKTNIHRDAKKAQPIDVIQAEGHFKLTEPDLRVDGSKGIVNTETATDIIENAHFRLYDRHARGTADSITIQNRTKMTLKNATYTTCNPSRDTWTLKSNHVVLNKTTGRGRARHSRLYVYGMPIFYWPYVDFPIDDRRQTGFLFPNFGSSNRSGLELGTPFYWNLAPNYDATLTPRLMSKRGLEMQGEFRYLTVHNHGELAGSFLPNDKAYEKFRADKKLNHPYIKNPLDPRLTALDKGNNRSAFRINHGTSFNQHWGTTVQYQTVHDDNYFMDFGTNLGLASTTQLLQQGDLYFHSNHWNMQTRLQQYQTLHPFDGPRTQDVYRRLPQIALQGSYFDLPLGLAFTTNGDLTRFHHARNPYTGRSFTTGDRFQIRPGIALPIIAPGWFIKPRFQYDVLSYSLAVGPSDVRYLRSNPCRAIPMVDLDSGLIFERSLALKETPYIQTLEPRAYYLYVPYRDQTRLPNFDTSNPGFDYNQLFWDNRFTGLDRLGDANQVTLALTSRFIAEVTGLEKLSLTAGQIHYFHEATVTSCNPKTNRLCVQRELPNGQHHHSSFVGLARYAIQEAWIARANLEWNPYSKNMDKKALSIQYHPEDRFVINLGYQFLRKNPAKNDPITGLPERLDQTDASMAYPVNEKWRVLGRWYYDLHNRRTNDVSFGVEQQGCCTAVRLLVSNFLLPYDDHQIGAPKRHAKAIFLQFIFKGFTSVGNSAIDSTLKRSIPDYQWHEERD